MKITKNTKESIQFIASIFVLLCGIGLIAASLIMPPLGVIDPTVITCFGMFLGFVGAVWNIDLKYDFKTRELRNKMLDERIKELDDQLKENEEEEYDAEELN